ncbi:hypothetical protein COV86_01990, partial [Candidatus Roizmanbacteria bacterium CG11_big_fil_rev_8_21_14_0_20_35_14]
SGAFYFFSHSKTLPHNRPNICARPFLEMGFAHVLHKKIYLLHPIPEMGYTTEIIAMQPILLEGKLENL